MTTRLPIYSGASALLVAVASIAACGSSDTGTDAECLEVSAAVVERIEMPAMAENPAAPITISKAQAVKAVDNYYIAARFDAPGGDEQTGVWATSSLDGSGAQIYSTEGYSHEFTRWPEAPGIDGSKQYVQTAKSCL
ncbi:hypothetical protein [Rhodococcus globerulus]|uniref:hypothetical protein n=1 Tax=Rhodococcus globerulus TaxID=33008 RepID=UPI00301692DA